MYYGPTYYGHTYYCHQVRVAEEVDAAERFAMASPEPTLADLDAAVFAPRRSTAPTAPSTAPTAPSTAAAVAAPFEVSSGAETKATGANETNEVTKATEATEATEQWLSFPEAIADAHRVAMRTDPKVVVMGLTVTPNPNS